MRPHLHSDTDRIMTKLRTSRGLYLVYPLKSRLQSEADAAGITSMLTSTFVHLKGIGSSTERRLWEEGIADWTAFREKSQLPELCRYLGQLYLCGIRILYFFCFLKISIFFVIVLWLSLVVFRLLLLQCACFDSL